MSVASSWCIMKPIWYRLDRSSIEMTCRGEGGRFWGGLGGRGEGGEIQGRLRSR